MTDRNPEEDLKVCEAASPPELWNASEPWLNQDDGGFAAVGPHHEATAVERDEMPLYEDEPGVPCRQRAVADQMFINLAPTALPYYIRETIALRERVAELESDIDCKAQYQRDGTGPYAPKLD